MKLNPILYIVCPLPLICCGCSSESANTAEIGKQSETTAVALHSETTTQTIAVTVSQSHTTLAIAGDPKRFQGGIGGEQDANTPKPEFFSYWFQPDAFSARLAGGNYQTVSYHLSEAFRHNIDEEYFLFDYDADGDYALYLPDVYDDQRVSKYMVFLWDSENEKFCTEPLLDIDAE